MTDLDEATVPSLALRYLPPDMFLEQSVLRALAYADVFDYPLTADEVYRYLPDCRAEPEQVHAALRQGLYFDGRIERNGPYFTLAGRGDLVEVRQARLRKAADLWPRARRYAAWLAALPFTRMVALTGALAVENEPDVDIDFLVVTEPGRLWLCRGLAMLLVRWARRSGDQLCPNYFITTRALSFPTRTLYTAHELAQMIPLSGLPIYQRIRAANGWLSKFLPNAVGAPLSRSFRNERAVPKGLFESAARGWLETVLRTPAGNRLENWEMKRKVRKLTAQSSPQAEADFALDWCKGHFGGYGRQSLDAYQARLERLGL